MSSIFRGSNNLSCNFLLVVEYLGCCDQETIEERLFPKILTDGSWRFLRWWKTASFHWYPWILSNKMSCMTTYFPQRLISCRMKLYHIFSQKLFWTIQGIHFFLKRKKMFSFVSNSLSLYVTVNTNKGKVLTKPHCIQCSTHLRVGRYVWECCQRQEVRRVQKKFPVPGLLS